jgi:hypothetical protein
MIYFVQEDNSRAKGLPTSDDSIRIGLLVKIGYTRNLRVRLPNLDHEYGCRFRVIATLPADRRRERSLHRRFAKMQVAPGREFFYPWPEIWRYLVERLPEDPRFDWQRRADRTPPRFKVEREG